MASIAELIVLFDKGELGKLLAQKFDGERGQVYPSEDSDLLVVFKSKEKTPDIQAIARTVVGHYSALGYQVESKISPSECLEATIFVGSRDGGMVHVVITTHYPFPAPGQGTASLRITSTKIV